MKHYYIVPKAVADRSYVDNEAAAGTPGARHLLSFVLGEQLADHEVTRTSIRDGWQQPNSWSEEGVDEWRRALLDAGLVKRAPEGT